MKNRFLSLLCALILLVSVMPSAAAQEGESIQAANTLISLNLVDGGDQVPDGLDKKPAERAVANKLLLALSGVFMMIYNDYQKKYIDKTESVDKPLEYVGKD